MGRADAAAVAATAQGKALSQAGRDPTAPSPAAGLGYTTRSRKYKPVHVQIQRKGLLNAN